jgi:hypothetical protein
VAELGRLDGPPKSQTSQQLSHEPVPRRYIGIFLVHLLIPHAADVSAKTHSTLYADHAFRKILAIGTVSLCANLALLITDKMHYKQILGQRGEAAQVLLDLLQAVCLKFLLHKLSL